MIKLLSSDIACVPIEDPDRTPSGLYKPDSAKQRVDQGIVKYTGPDVETVRRGDHIIFGGYVGQKLSLEGEGILYLMQESDVVAVILESTERLVTQSEVIDFIRAIEGEMIMEHIADDEAIKYLCTHLEDRVRDYFYSAGLEF